MKIDFKSVKQMKPDELIKEVFELRSQVQIIKDTFNKEKEDLMIQINELIKDKEELLKEYLAEQIKYNSLKVIDILIFKVKTLSKTLFNKIVNMFKRNN